MILLAVGQAYFIFFIYANVYFHHFTYFSHTFTSSFQRKLKFFTVSKKQVSMEEPYPKINVLWNTHERY